MSAVHLPVAIARIRATGATVSTIIGHDPNIGDWRYRVSHANGASIVEECIYQMGEGIPTKPQRDAAAIRIAIKMIAMADWLEAPK